MHHNHGLDDYFKDVSVPKLIYIFNEIKIQDFSENG